jgi:hypothetical protein
MTISHVNLTISIKFIEVALEIALTFFDFFCSGLA